MNQRPRTRRRFARIARWVALGVTIALAAIFVLSDRYSLALGSGDYAVYINFGKVQFVRWNADLHIRQGLEFGEHQPGLDDWWFASFHTRHMDSIVVPLWPFIALSIGATLWFARRARYCPPGHCRKCRYDLRGLAPNSPCPECGRASKPGAAP